MLIIINKGQMAFFFSFKNKHVRQALQVLDTASRFIKLQMALKYESIKQ